MASVIAGLDDDLSGLFGTKPLPESVMTICELDL